MDLSKNKTEETEHNKFYEINMSQSKHQSWNKGNQTKLDFLLCLVKYIAARDEPWKSVAITDLCFEVRGLYVDKVNLGPHDPT